MTTRPRLKLGSHLIPGLAAVALFVVMAAAFLSAEFPTPEGFGTGSVTANIGYALFNLNGMNGMIPSENFLIAFEIIDIVLVAALAAAVMLARREGESGPLGGSSEDVRTDGGKKNTEDDH
jgi:NADH-quinone oxidoreductase subunit J